jgi:hypothetical protein
MVPRIAIKGDIIVINRLRDYAGAWKRLVVLEIEVVESGAKTESALRIKPARAENQSFETRIIQYSCAHEGIAPAFVPRDRLLEIY